jgi:hypothetical protein
MALRLVISEFGGGGHSCVVWCGVVLEVVLVGVVGMGVCVLGWACTCCVCVGGGVIAVMVECCIVVLCWQLAVAGGVVQSIASLPNPNTPEQQTPQPLRQSNQNPSTTSSTITTITHTHANTHSLSFPQHT